MELAIDTSTHTAGVAVSAQGKILAELNWNAGQNHTAQLLPNAVYLLGQMGLTINEVKVVIVARGPGSFNGLRAGVATAKGLAFALGIPVVGISTLEAMAFAYAHVSRTVCPVLSAGRGEIYTAVFQQKRGKLVRVIEEQITTLDVLLALTSGKTVFCGDVGCEAASIVNEKMGGKAVIVDHNTGAGLRRAGYLVDIGWRKFISRDVDDAVTLEPLYLRKPSITMPKVGH